MSDKSVSSLSSKFDTVAPTSNYPSRVAAGLAKATSKKLLSAIGSVPGFGGLKRKANGPKQQVLSSGVVDLARWYISDFGTNEKPQALDELPLDYIEKNQEEIPFFGLREYWYPALQSKDLPHNKPVPLTILGDNVVFFRDGDGAPCALENRCPHRNPLLSLGQVNVWEPGTITCRYHGMTFDKEGECVAFLADGPDSPACGKVKARSYPAIEHYGIVWIYMGVKDAPDLLESLPTGHEDVFGDGVSYCMQIEVPYSYLNLLDNTVDMSHVGVLHRTCFLFGDQKMAGGVGFDEIEKNGVHAYLKEPGGHAGGNHIDEIRWYPPNLVYHGDELLDGGMKGMWFWCVPKDAGSFVGWQIGTFNDKVLGKVKSRFMRKLIQTAFLKAQKIPAAACFEAGDGPIQMSQGRIVRWDNEKLSRVDRATVRVRNIMKDLHKAEIAERVSKGLPGLEHRVESKQYSVST